MRIRGIAWTGLLVLALVWVSTAVSSANPAREQTLEKKLLLEAQAYYQIEFLLQTELVGQPAQFALYIHTGDDTYLQSTHLHRSLGQQGAWHPVVFDLQTPPGAQQASLRYRPDDPTVREFPGFNLRRIPPPAQESVQERDSTMYTGLIIDARGLELQRGMSPRIWSAAGELIYAGVAASPNYVQHEGVVSYSTDLSSAVLQRMQPLDVDTEPHPLIIPAETTTGPARTSVVISDASAETILQALADYDFLTEYAVVFLID